MPHGKTESEVYRVQVLDRSLMILDALSAAHTDLGLAEVADRVRMHKSTVHRLLMVLEQHRVVERDPLTARYRLGLRLFELGSAAIARFDIRARALPHLERLLHATHETIHLCLLDEGEVIYLDKMEPARSVRMSSGIGRRNPVHCTAVGKAILAWLPVAEVELIVHQHGLQQFTRHTITTLAELHAELQKVRAQGYAVDDEENEEGVRCVGAAVMDHLGYPAAAVSVSAPSFRLSPEKVPLVGAQVVAAVREISAEWGYRSDRLLKECVDER